MIRVAVVALLAALSALSTLVDPTREVKTTKGEREVKTGSLTCEHVGREARQERSSRYGIGWRSFVPPDPG